MAGALGPLLACSGLCLVDGDVQAGKEPVEGPGWKGLHPVVPLELLLHLGDRQRAREALRGLDRRRFRAVQTCHPAVPTRSKPHRTALNAPGPDRSKRTWPGAMWMVTVEPPASYLG